MLLGCLCFAIMGALVKLLGQRLDSMQIAFFRCAVAFLATLPFVLHKKGHGAFRTIHPFGHLLRGGVGVAAMMASFFATARLPLTTSTAISFTTPLFMIPIAVLLLGEIVRWRRGLATLAGFLGVLIMVRPDTSSLDPAAMIGLFAALLSALSVILIKRLSGTEGILTILLYFALVSSVLAAIPAALVWLPMTRLELVLLAAVGILGALGQFCVVRAYALGELTAIAPIDYSRLVIAGIMGFVLFAELPDRYTVGGALIIVGATLYIARREAHLSRLHREELAARPLEPHPNEPVRTEPTEAPKAVEDSSRALPAGAGGR
ncbi:MAG: DMT family transporter [Alphaproteobacteria bacterium]|nr:DMT family transporter [Alphaproteobacteria bacterium]